MKRTKKLTIEEYHPTNIHFSLEEKIKQQVEMESLAEWSNREISVPEPKELTYTLPNNMTSYTAMHAFMMELRP